MFLYVFVVCRFIGAFLNGLHLVSWLLDFVCILFLGIWSFPVYPGQGDRMNPFLITILAMGLLFTACQRRPHAPIDLDDIKKRKRLIALTGYDANSYFIYKGQPMGYEYEMLSRFAKNLGLSLEMRVQKNKDTIFEALMNGQGDILAANLTVTKERRQKYKFTNHLMTTRQVLVQRKPQNWQKMAKAQLSKKLVRHTIDLIGKTVHVRKESSYYSRLRSLSDEIGGDIFIVPAPGDMPTDELIKQVAQGDIDYTVADENIALVNQANYPILDIKTPISFPQKIAWAVRPESLDLLEAVNEWIDQMKKQPLFHVIYNKYYKNKRKFRERLSSEFFSQKTGKISEYDELIKKEANAMNWDWRILAAQMYQESQFDPKAESWAGAVGLMQLMPKTAAGFGATDLLDPVENIRAGTSYLKWLDIYWAQDIPDDEERLKFILGSYNAGQGHVLDARKLTEMHGKNPNLWAHVSQFVLLLSEEKYFNDRNVRFGYCRGEEPVNYVKGILERYEHYKKFVE